MSEGKFPLLKENCNFAHWKYRIDLLLEEKGINLKEEIKDDKQKRILDTKARAIIVQCLEDKYLDIISKCQTSEEMINVLQETFQRSSIQNKMHLKKKLLTIKCQPNEKLQEFFMRFEQIINELEAVGCKFTEMDKVCNLLTALPKQYENVITAIETMNDLNISMNFVKARLLDTELKIKNNDEYHEPETAFITCFKCHKKGHIARNCNRGSGSSGRGRAFQGRGRTYPRRGRGAGRQYFNGRYEYQNQYNNTVNYAEDPSSFLFLSTGYCNNVNYKISEKIEWVIDSGCTEHLINSNFEQYMTNVNILSEPIKIYIANGDSLIAKKKGTIDVICQGRNIKLEALLIDNINFNLLSVKKIVQNNFEVNFNKDYVRIFCCRTNRSIKGTCVGKLYILNTNVNANVCNAASSDDLWHRRLGHLNRRSLRLMNLPASEKPCGPCMMGKATRLPFNSVPRPRSRNIGEIIYSDIAGPMRTAGINGEIYYQVIIDDFSHFCNTYLLKHKSEAATNLINYIRRLENNKQTRVNKVRCDNGGEFKNRFFQNFCYQKGIEIQYSRPYSPQQNGVSERMNRTLYNRARTLLIETGLPKNLWTEAITCATYQLNRCPSSAIQFKTPAEIMFGDRDLSKLRAFGSKVWVLTMPKGDKLDERAKEMRMTGYAPNGYRLWDPSNNKIVISRDLKFDENDIKYIENKQEETQRRYFEEEEKEEYQNRETEQQFEEREEVTRETHMYERPVRERRLPTYLKDYQMENEGQDNSYDANIAFCLFNNSEDPETFEEAISKGEEWKTAIDSEISSLEEMNTWEEAKLPDEKKAIDTKWIFRTKQNGKKKARLVAKGFQTDSKYNVYSPVARVSTIRMMLSQAVQEDLPIRQLDVPTAFLNGYLSEAVYIKPPEGIRVKEGHVLKLRRSLYGLREAPKCWNERFNDFIVKQGFEQSYYDYCLYVNKDVWILIWVEHSFVKSLGLV